MNRCALVTRRLVSIAASIELRGSRWYLFGSTSRGDEDSDIDLLILHADGHHQEAADAREAIDKLCPPQPLDVQLMSVSEERALDFVRTERAVLIWSCRSLGVVQPQAVAKYEAP